MATRKFIITQIIELSELALNFVSIDILASKLSINEFTINSILFYYKIFKSKEGIWVLKASNQNVVSYSIVIWSKCSRS